MATSTVEGDRFTTCALVRIHPFSRLMMKPVPLPVPGVSGANGHTTVPRTLTVNRCASPSILPRSDPVCALAARDTERPAATAKTIEHARDMDGISDWVDILVAA